jgi:hypothetical protein
LFPGAVLLTILVSCTPDGLIEKSEPWDQIRYHEYLVENNTWNVQAAKSQWTETIFYDTIRGSMGWKWDFSGEDDEPDSFVVKSFPEIIVGRNPMMAISRQRHGSLRNCQRPGSASDMNTLQKPPVFTILLLISHLPIIKIRKKGISAQR